jgi:hypothetical protein
VDTFALPPLQGFGPSPANGMVNAPQTGLLSWSAGDKAQKRDVYLGQDAAAVAAADTSSPLYQGSQVGNLVAPFAERTIIHGGQQSMPLEYNNVNTPFYSEAEYAFVPQQNWTTNGVNTLSLWVRGNPAHFVDKGDGAFTVGASGHDIWDNADDFRFVYKRLSGNGSITVKVESLVNTNVWAKAGVNLAKVRTMYIGVGDRANPTAGGSGKIFVDDIRVLKQQEVPEALSQGRSVQEIAAPRAAGHACSPLHARRARAALPAPLAPSSSSQRRNLRRGAMATGRQQDGDTTKVCSGHRLGRQVLRMAKYPMKFSGSSADYHPRKISDMVWSERAQDDDVDETQDCGDGRDGTHAGPRRGDFRRRGHRKRRRKMAGDHQGSRHGVADRVRDLGNEGGRLLGSCPQYRPGRHEYPHDDGHSERG